MIDMLSDPIKIVVKQAGDVRIHTFISSFSSDQIANATHIIEGKSGLVLIDGQFLVPYAKMFRQYADSIGKPIHRLYVSHRHPDHWFGLSAGFTDIPVFALAETRDFIQKDGESSREDHWKLGDFIPDEIMVPQHVVKPGEEIIDGIRYEFTKVVDTEIDVLLTIKLPDLKVHIVQDLIYSGTHLYLTSDMKNWIRVLEGMLVTDYELFMPGHGLPADKCEIARNIEYLASARQAVAAGLTNDAFKDFLIKRYPSRMCPGIFDIYIPRLFGGARQY